MENKKLLVVYVGVKDRNIDLDDKLFNEIKDNIEKNLGGNYNCIITPDYNSNKNTIECIDPRYVTEEELIKENEEALKNLTKKILNTYG